MVAKTDVLRRNLAKTYYFTTAVDFAQYLESNYDK